MLPGSRLPRPQLRGWCRKPRSQLLEKSSGLPEAEPKSTRPNLDIFGCCEVKNAQRGFAVSDVRFVAKLAARAAALAFVAFAHARRTTNNGCLDCAGDCRCLRSPLSF